MSIEDDNSIDDKNKVGRIIVVLSKKTSTKPNKYDSMKYGILNIDRRNDLIEDRKSARSKDTNHADDKGRKDVSMQKSEKRILAASQMKEASESLRYLESKKSISEDNMIQERMELSNKRIEPVTSDNIME